MSLPHLPSSVREMSPVEAAWMGAIFEGEGSGVVGVYRTGARRKLQNTIRACVANSDPEVLSACLRLTGAGRIYYRAVNHAAVQRLIPSAKPMYQWWLGRKNDALDFLRQIAPYSWKAEGTLQRVQALGLGGGQ